MTDTLNREPPQPEAPEPDTGTTLPNDIQAERSVLGSIMIRRAALTDVLDAVHPADFYRPHHEQIFDAALHLFSEGDPVDAITVAAELRRRGNLTRVGGEAYLHDLVASVATPANASFYADIVHERALKRRLVTAGTRIAEIGYSDGDTAVDDVFARALSVLTTARPDTDHQGAHPWAPVDLTEILERGETVEQPTVLERTDGVCLLYPGTVHSIAAEPESGKSWVALIGTAQELRAGAHVTYLDFEDRPGRIVGRLLLLGVPPHRIRERFHYIRPMKKLDAAGTQHMEHAAARSSLVVVDGITEVMALHGLDLNDQTDIATFLALIPRRLADLGPAVLQVDHLPKTTEHDNRFAIGGQHKLAGLDGAGYMLKVIDPFGRGKKGKAILTVAKDREGAVREHTAGKTIAELVIDATAGGFRAELDTPRRKESTTGRSGRHTSWRRSAVTSRNTPTSPPARSNRTSRASHPRNATRCGSFELEGRIEHTPGARGAKHYVSVTPYREDDDQ